MKEILVFIATLLVGLTYATHIPEVVLTWEDLQPKFLETDTAFVAIPKETTNNLASNTWIDGNYTTILNLTTDERSFKLTQVIHTP